MKKRAYSLLELTGLIVSFTGFVAFFIIPNMATYVHNASRSFSTYNVYAPCGVGSASKLVCNNIIAMVCPKCQSKMLFENTVGIKPFSLCDPCANCGNITFFVTPELIAEVENKNSWSWRDFFGIICGWVFSFFMGFTSSFAANRCTQSGGTGKVVKSPSDKAADF